METKNPREIRKRIKSVTDTEQLTKAMKMVASVRFKRAYQLMAANRPYSESLKHLVSDLAASLGDGIDHPYFKAGAKAKRELLVVVGADKGLCGSYNSNMLRFAAKYIAGKKPGSVDIIAIGKKVKDYLVRRNYKVIDSEVGIFQAFNYKLSADMADKLVDEFLDSEYAEVNLLYNEFRNAAQTIIKVEHLLPLSIKGKKSNLDYIYEPGMQKILEVLLPKYLKVCVHKMFLEANASEQGLRMSSMDQANKNARDIIKDLTLVYNKARQGSITRELADLVGGAEAVV